MEDFRRTLGQFQVLLIRCHERRGDVEALIRWNKHAAKRTIAEYLRKLCGMSTRPVGGPTWGSEGVGGAAVLEGGWEGDSGVAAPEGGLKLLAGFPSKI